MFKIRYKFALGYGGLLAIILILGTQSVRDLGRLGSSIDVILRENYRSVIACQDMKEALERIDSGLLFLLLGERGRGSDLVQTYEGVFAKALETEIHNITLPGEREGVERIKSLFAAFKAGVDDLRNRPPNDRQGRVVYFERLHPLFLQIKETAQDILDSNQRNMSEANDRARRSAASAKGQMMILVIGGLGLSAVFLALTHYWILRPIRRLTQSAEEIKKGHLELLIPTRSRDEIGRLSETFNEMAAALRENRRLDEKKLTRIQKAAERTFQSLPDAVAIVGPEGTVEIATETARLVFGLKPEQPLRELPLQWINEVFHEALDLGRSVAAKGKTDLIQRFVNGEEHYFRPEAIPILDHERHPTGVVLVLRDVTRDHEQDELKRGLISTVSHQLLTPLTSLRMAIHLLLDEKVGLLAPRQAELLMVAREDCDRLDRILNNLLDLSRFESGRARLELRSVPAKTLIEEAVEPFRTAFKDKGLDLGIEAGDDLPDVRVDPSRLQHVFSNLLSNALRYTDSGGKVTVRASADEEGVHISVADTGKGIPPEHLSRIFDEFFRVPDEGAPKGTGLGLAIAKEIVEAHQGSIRAESRFGEGSTITFTLPRAGRPTAEAGRP